MARHTLRDLSCPRAVKWSVELRACRELPAECWLLTVVKRFKVKRFPLNMLQLYLVSRISAHCQHIAFSPGDCVRIFTRHYFFFCIWREGEAHKQRPPTLESSSFRLFHRRSCGAEVRRLWVTKALWYGWQWRAMVVWSTPLVLAWPRAALCLAFLWHREDRRPNTHVPLHTTTAKLWSSLSFFFFFLSFVFFLSLLLKNQQTHTHTLLH